MEKPYEVADRVLQSQPTAVMRARLRVEEMPQWFGMVFGAVASALGRQGAGPAGMPFARYHLVGEEEFEVEAGFPASRAIEREGQVEAGTLAGGHAASTWHVGPYDSMRPAYRALLDWISERGALPAGDPWEVYHSEPGGDPARYRTEVVQPNEEG